MNHVVLVGRLTRDPELRFTPGDGIPIVNFTLAINRPYKNKNGENEADFIFIEAWNKQAENIAKYCMKGSLVGVEGSL
ncbi:single-stranded DNA-binding protein, partial [Paraclostridium sordellii]|uniref:single-stranded DNA-binding protein n=1 Tax=Paraclostridium sordellii TaxID=1505 RepID=UPI000A9471B9